MRRATALALLIGAASVAPAGADERQIADAPVSDLTAGGGWVSWRSTERFAAQDDVLAPVIDAGGHFELGTDRRGRAVGVHGRCPGSTPCEVRERRIPGPRDRLLLRLPRDYSNFHADVHRGVLALARTSASGPRPPKTTFDVRAPGRRTLRWTQSSSVRALDLDARRLVTLTLPESTARVVQAVDVSGRRPRVRELAAVWDLGCRCSSTETVVDDAAIAGRYAYWLETTFRTRGGEPLGGGYPTDVTSRVVRVDLSARRALRQIVDLPRRAREFDVDGRRILYSGDDGLFELTGARWRR